MSRFDPSEEDEVTPDTEITFGKYRGATFQQILDRDPNYILWLINDCEYLGEEEKEMLADLYSGEMD